MNTSVVFGLIIGAVFGFCIGVAFTVMQDYKVRTTAVAHEEPASVDTLYGDFISRDGVIAKCNAILHISNNAYEHDAARAILKYVIDAPGANVR